MWLDHTDEVRQAILPIQHKILTGSPNRRSSMSSMSQSQQRLYLEALSAQGKRKAFHITDLAPIENMTYSATYNALRNHPYIEWKGSSKFAVIPTPLNAELEAWVKAKRKLTDARRETEISAMHHERHVETERVKTATYRAVCDDITTDVRTYSEALREVRDAKERLARSQKRKVNAGQALSEARAHYEKVCAENLND